MPPPLRQKLPTELSDLEWLVTDDGSRTLYDSKLNETYHSGCGAVAESLIVYLRNSGVLQRIFERNATSVFEVGFGTGSAFLLTAALAEKLSTRLDYWAIDIRPLPAQLLAQLEIQPHIANVINVNFGEKTAQQNFGGDRSFVSKLRSEISITADDFELLPKMTSELAQGLERTTFSCAEQPYFVTTLMLGQFVCLNLITGDMTGLEIERHYPKLISKIDAVFFDAFSPETCPELWTLEVMTQMQKLLSSDGTLTSYCVKSVIRKTLQAAGFSVTRLPGPVGGKREVLLANLRSQAVA